MENRRQHYRITYQHTDRPRFVHGTCISEVLECSERGVRIVPSGQMPVIGSRVTGRISMRHGALITVEGTVVWIENGVAALHLDTTPVPFLAMIREQLYLRRLAREQENTSQAADSGN